MKHKLFNICTLCSRVLCSFAIFFSFFFKFISKYLRQISGFRLITRERERERHGSVVSRPKYVRMYIYVYYVCTAAPKHVSNYLLTLVGTTYVCMYVWFWLPRSNVNNTNAYIHIYVHIYVGRLLLF